MVHRDVAKNAWACWRASIEDGEYRTHQTYRFPIQWNIFNIVVIFVSFNSFPLVTRACLLQNSTKKKSSYEKLNRFTFNIRSHFFIFFPLEGERGWRSTGQIEKGGQWERAEIVDFFLQFTVDELRIPECHGGSIGALLNWAKK